MRSVYLLVFFSAVSAASSAQVYRCTAPSGKVEYSDAPCSATSKDNRLVAPKVERSQREVELENEYLRRQLSEERLRRNARVPSSPPPVEAPPRPALGRTQADLQAERADSWECSKAKRDYDVLSGSITDRRRLPAAEVAMYSACGMRNPDKTIINVVPAPPSTCVRVGGSIHCH